MCPPAGLGWNVWPTCVGSIWTHLQNNTELSFVRRADTWVLPLRLNNRVTPNVIRGCRRHGKLTGHVSGSNWLFPLYSINGRIHALTSLFDRTVKFLLAALGPNVHLGLPVTLYCSLLNWGPLFLKNLSQSAMMASRIVLPCSYSSRVLPQ